jgi:hypothetical protein
MHRVGQKDSGITIILSIGSLESELVWYDIFGPHSARKNHTAIASVAARNVLEAMACMDGLFDSMGMVGLCVE